MWEHKPSKHNQVANALSCKQMQEFVASVMKVELDFVKRIEEGSKLNATY